MKTVPEATMMSSAKHTIAKMSHSGSRRLRVGAGEGLVITFLSFLEPGNHDNDYHDNEDD